jgi:segregation and condensation protein B
MIKELSLEARLEALLFVAPGFTSLGQMSAALAVTPRQVEKGLEALEASLSERGIRIQKHRGELRLISAPETAELVERFLDLEATTRLSAAALECLAIVAYQQPITRPQIDSIRGVNSESALKTLLSNGLVDEAGRTEGPGRPILYTTTAEFLQHFGLSALEELPPLDVQAIGAEVVNADNGSGLLKS